MATVTGPYPRPVIVRPVLRLVTGERIPLIQVVKTALAATLAWGVAELGAGHQAPFFAALAALLAVQPSVRQSLSRALERMAGVVGGVLMAFVFGALFGVHTWSVGLLLLASLLVAWALRLGPQGAVQVPVSALLVVAIGAGTPGYVRDRILDTALGAAIGVALNALVVPPVYVSPVRTAVVRLGAAIVALLRRIATELERPEAAALVDGWLAASRELVTLAQRAQAAITKAEESLRLNPVRRRQAAEVDAERDRLEVLTRVSVQVRGIARTLHDHLGAGSLSPTAVRILVDLIGHTASTVEAFVAGRPPPVGDLPAAVARLRLEARADPGPMWTVYGAIAEDLRRIQGETGNSDPR
jgi:uncharacterized membrane protein YgaE (UPF0421/DUF939 family)